MRIISYAHIDRHAKLLLLIDAAIHKIEARREKAKADLVEARRLRAEFETLPWYKRWFCLAEPCLYHARWAVDALTAKMAQIKKIQARCKFDLTIELDSVESDLVFQDYT